MSGGGPLYDRIGVGYDATRRADPRIADRLFDLLAAVPEAPVLDLACGTANYTARLAARGLRLTGLDRSPRMIAAARTKAPGVPFLLGDAAALPFARGAFAGAVCTLALHHFPDLDSVFAELRRVLGRGRLVILTATPEQMARYWLGDYFPEMMARSAVAMPALGRVRAALGAAGFGAVHTEPFAVPADLADLFLYAGKHRPALYLDPGVRAGISSFAALVGSAELSEGLARLAADIASGRVHDRIKAAEGPGGDYLFVQAEAG